jgi:hypothetical protein
MPITVMPSVPTSLPDLAKPADAPRFDVIDAPARPKPDEVTTCEPKAPGLTPAETAKLDALRHKRATPPSAGRSDR